MASPDTPSDLAQSALIRMLRRGGHSWQSRGEHEAWLARAVRDASAERARRVARRRGLLGAVSPQQPGTRAGPAEELEGALRALELASPRSGLIARCRISRGMSVAQTVAATGLSRATVAREWRSARTWLADRVLVGLHVKEPTSDRPTG